MFFVDFNFIFFSELVSSATDSTIKVWNLYDGVKLRDIDASPADSWSVSVSPDGSKIATGCHNGKVNIFNIETGAKETALKGGEKFIMSVCHVSFS